MLSCSAIQTNNQLPISVSAIGSFRFTLSSGQCFIGIRYLLLFYFVLSGAAHLYNRKQSPTCKEKFTFCNTKSCQGIRGNDTFACTLLSNTLIESFQSLVPRSTPYPKHLQFGKSRIFTDPSRGMTLHAQ